MAFGKRQLVLAALVVALGAAVYLNWQFTGDTGGLVEAGGTASEKSVGEAQLVNASAASSAPSAFSSAAEIWSWTASRSRSTVPWRSPICSTAAVRAE